MLSFTSPASPFSFRGKRKPTGANGFAISDFAVFIILLSEIENKENSNNFAVNWADFAVNVAIGENKIAVNWGLFCCKIWKIDPC